MAVETESKVVKLPAFDGNRKNFHMWWMRFMAYAMFYKFASCLKATAEADLPADEAEGANEGDNVKAARKRNSLAMYSFTLAFQTEGLLGMIYKARDTEWPTIGRAYKVVDALFKKYAPDDVMARVELRAQLAQIGMKHKKEDPTIMFEAISTVQNHYQGTSIAIAKEELIAIVLDKSMPEYKSVITSEQRVKGTQVTLEDLQSAMYDYWRAMYGSTSESSNNSKEILLGNVSSIQEDNGPGEQGDNSTSGDGDNQRNNDGIKCSYCKKKGHHEDKCWDKHLEKAPAWHGMKKQEGTEITASAIGKGKVIVL